MRFEHPLFADIERRASAAGPIIASQALGQPQWTPSRQYDKFAKETYCANVIAYTAIRRRARAVANIPWYLQRNGEDIDSHPAIDLLMRPNPKQAGPRLLETIEAFSAINGNAFLEVVTNARGIPQELYSLRPDRMSLETGASGLPKRWTYELAGNRRHWDMDEVSGRGEILHLQEFNPVDDYWGLGATEPAAYSIDQHNSAAAHNQALLQNQARPSGAFIFTPPMVNGVPSNVSIEQMQIVEQQILDKYGDPIRRGRPLVLGGQWTYQEMMLSPRELDFWEGSRENARQICAAYGVPHVLVVPGESTYANRENALLEFYEGTVLPSLKMLFAEVSAWLSYLYREPLTLRHDEDQVTALAPRRRDHRTSVISEWNAGLLTRDEAREALGWGASSQGGEEFRATPSAPLAISEQETRGREIKSVPSDDMDEEMIRITLPVIEAIIAAAGEQIFNEVDIGISFEIFDPNVQHFLQEFGAARIKQLVGTTTRAKLASALADGIEQGHTFQQRVEAIRGVFKEATEKRARLIARTETVRAAGFGADAAINQAGIEEKEWLSTLDDRLRDDPGVASHRAMHGQRVAAGGEFVDPTTGDRAPYPGGFGIAAQDIGCRCLVIAAPPDQRSRQALESKASAIAEARDSLRDRFTSELEAALIIAFRRQEKMVLDDYRNT